MQSSFKVRHTVLGRGISERIDGVEEAGCGTEGRFGSASWVLRSLSSRAVVWLTSHRPRHLPRVNLTERDEQPLTGTPRICLFYADHSRVHTILSVVPAQVFIRKAQRDQGILFEAVLTRSCYDNPPEYSLKNAL